MRATAIIAFCVCLLMITTIPIGDEIVDDKETVLNMVSVHNGLIDSSELGLQNNPGIFTEVPDYDFEVCNDLEEMWLGEGSLILDSNNDGIQDCKGLANTDTTQIEFMPEQIISFDKMKKNSIESPSIHIDTVLDVPSHVSGDWELSSGVNDNPASQAYNFFIDYGDLWRIEPSDDYFQISSVEQSPLGFTNVRMQQTYKLDNGLIVPVFGAEQIVHVKEGSVLSVHGKFVPGIEVDAQKVSSKKAQKTAEKDLKDRIPNVNVLSIDNSILAVYDPVVLERFTTSYPLLSWFIEITTEDPMGRWYYFIDATRGQVIDFWNDVQDVTTPSRIYDGRTNPDTLWYEDEECVHFAKGKCMPPDEVYRLAFITDQYYDYLYYTFENNDGDPMDSIDGEGMRLVGRARTSVPKASWQCGIPSSQVPDLCFASFNEGWVTQDVVAHEYSHGLVTFSGGDLEDSGQAGSLDEHFADVFAEFLGCHRGECNWLLGKDSEIITGSKPLRPPEGIQRSLSDPPAYGQPEHMTQYDSGTDDPHVNNGIPNKAIYLIAEGGTHYGVSVRGLGYQKAEQIVFATLVYTGITSTATFEEYARVMYWTCVAMIGEINGLTNDDCDEVADAWASVGLPIPSHPFELTSKSMTSSYDRYGYKLTSGDFNDDGYEDLVVGAPFKDVRRRNPMMDAMEIVEDAGIAIVFYGGLGGFWDPVTLEMRTYMIIDQEAYGFGPGSNAHDHFGYSLAAGDFDGDGDDDLAVGVPNKDVHGIEDAGMVIAFSSDYMGVKPGTAQPIHQETPGVDARNEAGERFGTSLAVLDNTYGGASDLAIGVPYQDVDNAEDTGMVIIIHGSSDGLLSASVPISAQFIDQFRYTGIQNEDRARFGLTLASGDFNGNGQDDLAVGAPYKDVVGYPYVPSSNNGFPVFSAGVNMVDAGIVAVLYNPILSLSHGPVEILHQGAVGASGRNAPEDHFGLSLATGDFNGDGFDELAVGIPDKDHEYLENEAWYVQNGGMVMVFYTFQGRFLYGSADFIWERRHAGNFWDYYDYAHGGDRFGSSLGVGDVNGDGYEDLAIGVPRKDIGVPPLTELTDAGRIRVCHGSRTVLMTHDCQKIHATDIGGSPGEGDRFGWAIALGDFEGDEQAELAISAPYLDFYPEVDNGQVYIGNLG